MPLSECREIMAPNIAARTHPFAVVSGERAPARWLRIVDSLRDRLNERLHALRGDGNGLLPIDLLQILHAVLRDRDQFGRIGGQGMIELDETVVTAGMPILSASRSNTRSLRANWSSSSSSVNLHHSPVSVVLKLPVVVAELLEDQEPRRPDLDMAALPQCIQ